MPIKVIKKDGDKEEFIKEKIVVSVVKTGAPVDVGREIADEVNKLPEKEIKTQFIRRLVLEELKRRNSNWHKTWVNYDESAKRLRKYKG